MGRLVPVAIAVGLLVIVGGAAGWAFLALLNRSPGIFGTVVLIEGDCMPVVEPGSNLCRTSPVSRTILVRQVVIYTEAIEDRYLVKPSPLVATGHSGIDGLYRVALQPGEYSVFVEDAGREYCGWATGDFACYVTVGNEPLRLDLNVDHAD